MSAVLDHRKIDWTRSGALRTVESGVLTFTKSATVTVEAFTDDAEIECEEYRATWTEDHNGDIQIQKIERNETRPGKPEVWIVDVMSFKEVVALENMIARQLVSERNEEDREPRSMRERIDMTEFWGVKA